MSIDWKLEVDIKLDLAYLEWKWNTIDLGIRNGIWGE